MSAGHHVPSSGVPGREMTIDTPTAPAKGGSRSDRTADANRLGSAAKFTIQDLPCPAAGPGKRRLAFSDPGRQTRTIYIFPSALYNLLFFGPHKYYARPWADDIYVRGRGARHKIVAARAGALPPNLKELA